VCVYSVFMLSCALVAALRWADPQTKESYRLCISVVSETGSDGLCISVVSETGSDGLCTAVVSETGSDGLCTAVVSETGGSGLAMGCVQHWFRKLDLFPSSLVQ
jgi:hypothetical protein